MAKFIISFKTPDALSDAVTDLENDGFSEDEAAHAKNVAGRFIQYGEYAHIEFDTETGKAKVLPVGEDDDD